eukprot:COSAG06_NODE_67357_length_252_cov_0.673203_1_plen_24_part_01
MSLHLDGMAGKSQLVRGMHTAVVD